MGLPKKKLSKTRKRTRAAHSALTKQSFGSCPKCKHAVQPHHACRLCGYYKGRDVLRLDVRKARSDKARTRATAAS